MDPKGTGVFDGADRDLPGNLASVHVDGGQGAECAGVNNPIKSRCCTEPTAYSSAREQARLIERSAVSLMRYKEEG